MISNSVEIKPTLEENFYPKSLNLFSESSEINQNDKFQLCFSNDSTEFTEESQRKSKKSFSLLETNGIGKKKLKRTHAQRLASAKSAKIYREKKKRQLQELNDKVARLETENVKLRSLKPLDLKLKEDNNLNTLLKEALALNQLQKIMLIEKERVLEAQAFLIPDLNNKIVQLQEQNQTLKEEAQKIQEMNKQVFQHIQMNDEKDCERITKLLEDNYENLTFEDFLGKSQGVSLLMEKE